MTLSPELKKALFARPERPLLHAAKLCGNCGVMRQLWYDPQELKEPVKLSCLHCGADLGETVFPPANEKI